MRVYQYPVSKFPFHNVTSLADFSSMTSSAEAPCLDDEALQTLYQAFINDPQFLDLYPKFLKYIGAFFENSGLATLNVPSLRFHQHSARYFSPTILPAKKTVIIPLTPLFGANSLCYESQPGLQDWNVINGKVGDFIVHEGTFRDTFYNGGGVHSLAMIVGYYRVP